MVYDDNQLYIKKTISITKPIIIDVFIKIYDETKQKNKKSALILKEFQDNILLLNVLCQPCTLIKKPFA